MDPLKIALYTLGFIVILVITQDFQIFPGAFISKVKNLCTRNKKLPPHISSQFIKSQDGTSLEVWQYQSEVRTRQSDYVAIIFHGNGGSLQDFIFIQMWLAELGIRSYSFDYRGYGRSSGWPGEKGIYLDSDSIWNYVIKEEAIPPSKILVFGISVGSAPAARIAALHAPKLLVLSSAFTDLKSTVRSKPIIGLLWPFIWHKFPTIEYLRDLRSTDLILVHGLKDSIVPTDHSVKLEAAYTGTGRACRITSENAGHNMAFYDLKDELKHTLLDWLYS